MPKGEDRASSPKNLEGPSRISSGKELAEGSESTDEIAVRKFLHNSVFKSKLDGAIVDLIVEDGGVTKLDVLEYLTLEDLLRWKTPAGLTPNRHVDRLPQFEVCESCSTQDQTVMTCRIDAQTLMKLCRPCASMVSIIWA